MREVLLEPPNDSAGRHSVPAARIASVYCEPPEGFDEALHSFPIQRNQLVSHSERVLRLRQEQTVDRIDEHRAIVNVHGEAEHRAKWRRKEDGCMSVVERRKVLDERFVKVQVVGLMNSLEPRRQPVQVE